LPKTIVIHHRHGGTTKSRQTPLPIAKEMDKEFLFAHALSLWRTIEMEGRAFPANNISVAVTGFSDVEDGVQGIKAFLVKDFSVVRNLNSSEVEVLGKRKRHESAGITKFLSQKNEDNSREGEPAIPQFQREDVQSEIEQEVKRNDEDEDDRVDDATYSCHKCRRRIPLEELEVHEDYHVALELSRRSPIQSSKPAIGLPTRNLDTKEGKRPIQRKGRKEEKGQMKLEFSRPA
jgi:DNA polymerase eta